MHLHVPFYTLSQICIAEDEFMTEHHEALLSGNLHLIASKLTCIPEVLDKLVADKIFHLSEMDEVLNETRSRQASALVRLLVKKADQGFFTFVEALSTTNKPLANQLTMYKGKIRQINTDR